MSVAASWRQTPRSEVSYLLARGYTLEEIEYDWQWLEAHMLGKLGMLEFRLMCLIPVERLAWYAGMS